MDDIILMLIAGIIGLAIGVAGMSAYRESQNRRSLLAEKVEAELPPGSIEVLSIVGRAFVVVDEIDGVVRANPSAYAYGLVRGHTLVHPELVELAHRVRAHGVIEEKQFELSRGPLGQGTIVVHVRVAALGDEFILLLADDRTEITRTEAIRTDFVANVSHELKTPVGAIMLLGEAMDDAAGDEVAIRRFAGRLQKESARLKALVQDIIELSRLQGTNVVVQGKPVDINDVVAEAVDRTKLTADNKNITLSMGLAKEPAMVFGDQELLTTAFKNLIDNAIRYSPEDTAVGVGVRVKDSLVQVSVTDRGPGIPVEEQERIFERFYRVDEARDRQTGGTGLGLSIVKHVVSNHGGEVTVWSQINSGSTFTVRLPELEDAGVPQGKGAEIKGTLSAPDEGGRP
ncbi:two-component system sensor histidine kinase SenX3 [Neomicrococcus aestuarii]|uniref:Sensor-like histidine kinase SenX3 n=1 Tax=Neomicrococcus aestuarii TaxID=556325 RepID=A0A7W8TVN0_9MICC|nr:two-component system sensor histidine kinase SenX3 [Neomicrococcus aestuarii]